MLRNAIGIAVLMLAFVGCGGGDDGAADTTAAPDTATLAGPQMAQAVLRDANGREIGMVNLTQEGAGVRISLHLAPVPTGEKGFHIHEVGTCDAPAFEGAGDHLNPDGRSHGFDDPAGPHAGDLRNLTVAADSMAMASELNDRVTLVAGQPNSLLDADGSAIIVHADPDNYRTQPAGNTGARIACGVIEPV
jgi:Cu-Zn family superoxide dismutase